MPPRPRGLLEPCAATSGTHGSEGAPAAAMRPGLPDNRAHWVRDVVYDEDRSRVRTDNAPQVMATLCNTAISLLRLTGATNIAASLRHHAARTERPITLVLTS